MCTVWHLFELMPFRRLSYNDKTHTTSLPHLWKGRVIKKGQKIHASVAFKRNYTPKAKFAHDVKQDWSNILGKATPENLSWVGGMEDILEFDLFDHSNVNVITTINEINRDTSNYPLIGRLKFLASTGEGARAIAHADPTFALFKEMLDGARGEKLAGMEILGKLAIHPSLRSSIMQAPDVISALANTMNSGESEVQTEAAKLMSLFSEDDAA